MRKSILALAAMACMVRGGGLSDSGLSSPLVQRINADQTKLDLFKAAEQGDHATLRRILDKQPKLATVCNIFGESLVLLAAESETSVLQLLVDHGASLSQQDENHSSPLMRVVALAKVDNVSFLLSKGVPLNGVNAQGWSAAMLAAYLGNDKILELLLAHKPDLSTAHPSFGTALEIAEQRGHGVCIELLRAHSSAY